VSGVIVTQADLDAAHIKTLNDLVASLEKENARLRANGEKIIACLCNRCLENLDKLT